MWVFECDIDSSIDSFFNFISHVIIDGVRQAISFQTLKWEKSVVFPFINYPWKRFDFIWYLEYLYKLHGKFIRVFE